MKKVLSIITVAYNNPSDIRRELRSLYDYNDLGCGMEIIVVDHSDQTIITRLKEEYPDVVFLRHENNGFGAGNNYGAKYASGEYLCFLNPDTILVEPIFKKIIETFDKNDRVGIIGTQLRDTKMKKNMSFYYIDRNSIFHKQLIRFLNKISLFDGKRMYVSGANLFIRSDLFNMAGLFDEKMFMYYEEPDLTKRIMDMGYITKFMKDLNIIHIEGKTTTLPQDILKRKYVSAKYYCMKYSLNYRHLLVHDYRYSVIKYITARLLGDAKYSEYMSCCDCIMKEIKEYDGKG